MEVPAMLELLQMQKFCLRVFLFCSYHSIEGNQTVLVVVKSIFLNLETSMVIFISQKRLCAQISSYM